MRAFIVLLVVVGARADITGTNPPEGSCLCLSHTDVNIRDSACGSVISTESNTCYKYRGDKTTCDLSGVSYEFFDVDHTSGVASIAGDFLNLATDTQCGDPPPPATCNGVTIVSRAEWGARAPAYNIGPLPNKPVPHGFVHHTVTGFCSNQADCSAIMRSMQNNHMDVNGWPDIGYNYLVGEDGLAYEGRGWDKLGAHTVCYNDIGVAVSAIGDFTSRPPNQAALDTIRSLFQCAIDQGVLSSSFDLHGHRDANPTACPGDSLYPVIQTWPEYSFETIDRCRSQDRFYDEV